MSESGRRLFVGTAGWSIPRACAERCPGEGTHLQRYSRIFPGAEINSSFHRPHAAATYAKWAASTPPHFRFAVKLPRTITHEQKLRRARVPLERFLEESSGLGAKRGPLLVQLPPSLEFDRRTAATFFTLLRLRHDGVVVCEPRHPTWFTRNAEAVLVAHEIARVAADPPPAPGADLPGGWPGIAYVRLHGSPRKYWSKYTADTIERLASLMCDATNDAWCVFDNTASGAALENAWELGEALATSA
jgi:uncharacterized protein YecE (DUF72 family)